MVGIIVAMDKELAGWLDAVAVREIVRVADKAFYLGTCEGTELVIAQSGVGKVNAAITAALMCSRYQVDYVVNTGVAGGVFPSRTGDLAVATRVLYADVDVTAIDPVPYGQMAGEKLYALADPALLERAARILGRLGMPHRFGTIASADRFVTDPAVLSPIRAHTADVVAVDMESMAVAHAAEVFGVPFVVIRGISDVIDAPGQVDGYRDVAAAICANTAAFVRAFLRG
ncbi:MAG: 5'-methylthioadenosine/adenosylhomocysteine nucleosidase [Candidatus Izemoplasmatales bacterium]